MRMMRRTALIQTVSVFSLTLALTTAAAGSAKAPVADAAEKLDRAAVRMLLKQHGDVNAPQVDGMTALHWAVYQDDLELAKLLVKGGANVKAENRYGVTPLSLTCVNGNAGLVELLLAAGRSEERRVGKECRS